MSGPCACFTSMYIQNLSTTHAFAVVQRLVCTSCHPPLASYVVSHFLASHSLKLAPLGLGPLFGRGLFLLQSTFLLFFLQSLHVLPYCFVILVVALFDPSLLGLFGFVAYSSFNDLVQSFGLFGYVGHPWPIYFPWTLLAIFLSLHSHRFLLTPLSFPDPITLSFIFGAHGLSINPYFPYFHYFGPTVAHSHFSTLHTAHEFASSLFPGSFRPVYFLKAHLFIL